MKERKKTWLSLFFVLSLSLLLIAAIIYFTVANREKYKDQRYEFYFLADSAQAKIESESRYLFFDSSEDLPLLLVESLFDGPEQDGLISPFPKDLRALNVSLAGNTLSIVFSEHYDTLDPYMRNLADCCLYQTVSALPEVRQVFLRVSGNAQNASTRLTADTFLISDRFFETIEQEFTLYYPNRSLTGLESIRYPYTMRFGQSEPETALDLLEHKIFPLQAYENMPSPLVNDVLFDDSVAHVDLSADLLIIQETVDAEEYAARIEQNIIFLQAIVTTLTSIDNISGVVFTFDHTVMGMYGDLDLSEELTIYNFQ